MKITDELANKINGSINEAIFYNLSVDLNNNITKIFVQMATCTKQMEIKNQILVEILLSNVSNIVCFYEENEKLIEINSLSQIIDVIKESGGAAIYGWEFISEKEWKKNKNRKSSYIWERKNSKDSRIFNIFHDGADVGKNHFIDLYIWFEDLEMEKNDLRYSTKEIIDAGYKWWEEFYANNKQTQQPIYRPVLKADDKVIYSDATIAKPLEN